MKNNYFKRLNKKEMDVIKSIKSIEEMECENDNSAMMAVVESCSKISKKLDGIASVSLEMHKPYKMYAGIKIMLDSINLDEDIIKFMYNEIKLANSIDIYKNNNNNIIIDIGYYGMVKINGGKGE